jgi:hypothetical protein
MSTNKYINSTVLIFLCITSIGLITSGYCGDHFGDYLNDQAPSDYSEATGWRKTTGYIFVFAILVFMGRQIWKSWRDKD